MKLYNDVAEIHSRLPNYDPEEVTAWLQSMEQELVAYAARMSSMMAAASDESELAAACSRLREAGAELVRVGPFTVAGADKPLAWGLVAQPAVEGSTET